ncbi:MAG: hypothetical protein HOQ05_13690 [Corynebacteriales bacterium]|nr:hypothetical protein [Mycobacteriales bacterium]
MTFDPNADLDTSHVDDVRGKSGWLGGATGNTGGKGPPIPNRGLLGGGIVGIILTIVVVVIGLKSGINLNNDPSGAGITPVGDNQALAEKCAKTNTARFDEVDCRQLATFEDLRSYWSTTGSSALSVPYTDPRFVLFSNTVTTGCGRASSAVGPFYCPADQRIYIDIDFYNQLESDFGATGQFAQSYVLAHEFGHHIQYLTGAEAQVRREQQRNPRNANQYSIALELQADCYAGAWTKAASAPGGIITDVTDEQLRSALSAASAVGDDRIQEKAQGQIDEESWTHGSAQQRQQWFQQGYTNGDPRVCNTFVAQ